jgi:hyperosmotically inducible periplasmic protein
VLRILLGNVPHLNRCMTFGKLTLEGLRKATSMIIRRNTVRALFAISLIALVGFTIGAPRLSAGTKTSPVVDPISRQVHSKLVTLPWYGVFDNLQYQINGTEVTLSGQLVSEHSVTKHDAENAVKSISGVTKVVNNIEVLPPSPFDDQIRRAEYRTIFSQSDLGRYTVGAVAQVRIVVKNGHVTLEGQVMNQMDKNIAGIVANSVPGVFSVTNNLRIG